MKSRKILAFRPLNVNKIPAKTLAGRPLLRAGIDEDLGPLCAVSFLLAFGPTPR
jgi:hypothetical protein